MREFAEKQGWHINRNGDGALERFCLEISVKRHVLKEWGGVPGGGGRGGGVCDPGLVHIAMTLDAHYLRG
ncbi:hypothetical protein E2562_005642 [Oryza meyeriana var. granulata]|uniref:Uncharacterized protein n=1 Tax=Oryza meyeriana var. granulata TaxID=110450 RepID=A0A6G1BJP4_9ORYZ|nr:hypothetical protein E2562_005642 [Oryza meyeriana var. granulata]